MISSSQRHLPDNIQHSQQTGIHAPDRIRTHNLSGRPAAEQRLRSRGQRDRHYLIKVKWSRYRPGVAQRMGRGIALLFHDRGTRRGWVVRSTPRPHFTPGKDPVPILQEAGGPQGRPGRAENHVPTGIRFRTVQLVVSRYTDWAIRPTGKPKYTEQNLSQCRFVQRACHRNCSGTGDTTLQMLWTKESFSRKTGVN